MKKWKNNTHQLKKCIIFDLDGTLAVSKSQFDTEMASLQYKLMGFTKPGID